MHKYDCHGVVNDTKDPNARDWHYTRDVRAQVQTEAARRGFGQKGYPSHYGNKGPNALQLSAPKPLSHVPIIPGKPTPYQAGNPPGGHRGVYNDQNRNQVDVIYHHSNQPVPAGSKFAPYSKAYYVPKVPKA